MLPIPKSKLSAFIHSHVHSTWVFGTEVQGPDLRTIQKIRTAIVDAFDASSHRMRSPFLFLATSEDPFLDPFAKWVRHVLVHLLAVCERATTDAEEILQDILNRQVPNSSACNGFRNVLSYVLARIQWKVSSPDDLSFDTPNGIVSFANIDRSQLNHILSLTMRDFLLRQVVNRHDCGEIPPGQQIDIELTRMLLDSPFSKASLHEIIQPYLQFLPTNVDHAKSIL